MSCGGPHETPCDEVLAQVYEYIDDEVDIERRMLIRAHLEECGHCLEEYGLEEVIKTVVHRSCGSDPVPTHLRERVLAAMEMARGQTASPLG